MPKLLLVQPTQYAPDGSLCKQSRLYLPGLAFPLLAALLPEGWEVDIRLEVVDEVDPDTDADLVGIGSMGHATFRGLDLAREFRNRGKKVVMGGYMASLMSREVLKHVDSVVFGDAEASLPELLHDFSSTGKLKSVYSRPLTTLAGLPVPRYELLAQKPIGGMLPVQAGRGCPHTCSFCSIACLYRGRYLTRPVDEVVRDIRAVRDLGFRRFYLIDDNIVSRPDHLADLCRSIRPLRMEWATQCSLELARHPELLRLCVESGARMMSFGIESLSQEGLDRLDKKWVRVDRHEGAIRTISDAGIAVSSEMILGTDGDTGETLRDTVDFINRVRLPLPRFYILTPMPGTRFFHQVKSEGRLLTEDFTQYTGARAVHRPLRLSPEELTEGYWKVYRRTYSWRSILRRTLLHPNARRHPIVYLFAFFVSLHYRRYIRRKIPPNIF